MSACDAQRLNRIAWSRSIRGDAILEMLQPRFQGRLVGVLPVQDAPRAWMSSNRFLPITMLARPNRLNNCASFLASPL